MPACSSLCGLDVSILPLILPKSALAKTCGRAQNLLQQIVTQKVGIPVHLP